MSTTRPILLFTVFFCFLPQEVAAADATSVEVFVGREKTSRSEAVPTVPTVRTCVKRICFKLHVRSKVEAIIKYLS